jgi:tetratricopeptide (TPR) repeat protein
VEILAQGTAKFPQNAKLWFVYSKALDSVGQKQEAQVALEKAVQLDPKTFATQLLITVQQFSGAKQYDSAYVTLQTLVTKGVPDSAIALMALSIGDTLFRSGNASQNRADWQQALRFTRLSNKLWPSEAAQFLQGATAFSILQSAATEAVATKSCPLAQLERDSYAEAQSVLVGIKDQKYQSHAQMMLQYIPQFKASIDSQLRLYCK